MDNSTYDNDENLVSFLDGGFIITVLGSGFIETQGTRDDF